jgi:hypothetical protein
MIYIYNDKHTKNNLIPGEQHTSNVLFLFSSGDSGKQLSSSRPWFGFKQQLAISDEFVSVPKHSGLPFPTTSQRRRYELHKKLANSTLVKGHQEEGNALVKKD